MNKKVLVGVFAFLLTVRILRTLAFYRTIRNHEKVVASDGRAYYVLQRRDRIEAANILANVRYGLESLLSRLEIRKKKEEIPLTHRGLVSRLLRLFPNGRGLKLYEIDGNNEKSIAYTKNKTEGFYLCLRDKDDRLHPMDQALFLAIHELTHAGMIMFEPEVSGKTVHSERFRIGESFLYDIANQEGILNISGLPGRPHCGAYLLAPGNLK